MTSFVRARQQQLKSQSYQTLFGIQRNCEDQMKRIFELADSPDLGGGGPMREELFLRAVQSKNDCYARNVCPKEHAEALQCVLSPERVGSGACEQLLNSASECVASFWKRTIGPRAQELMQRYEQCNQGCAPAMAEYQKCVQSGGGGGVGGRESGCAAALLAAEQCLGACLAPAAGAALAQCRAAGGRCESEERAVLGARAAAGKDILLAMGFAESDFSATESSEQIMSVVGVVLFTGDIENQMMQQQQQMMKK